MSATAPVPLAGRPADRRQARHRPRQVEGTGIGGRVRKKDVLAYVESRTAHRSGRELRHRVPSTRESPYRARAARRTPRRDESTSCAGERREPMSPMRQAIAEHMVGSRRTAAHCTTIVEVDISRVAARARRAEASRWRAAASPSPTSRSSRGRRSRRSSEHPVLNASVDGDELVHHDDVNLGIAVALDDGLIVPVIRQAQRLSLEGLAAAIADLAERARDEAARARRRPRRHVHDHQPGPVRRGARDADHQPAAGRRSSTSRRSSSGRSSSTTRRRRRLDRDPPDDLPAACRGTTGRSTAPRRRGSSARSRPGSRDGRRVMAIAITTPANGRPDGSRDPPRIPPVRSTTRSSPSARDAQRPLRVVAVHSTALGPALGGAADVALPATADALATRCGSRGDDLEGGRRRARPRRRQGRDLRARRGRCDGERRRAAAARLRRPGRVARRPLHHRRGRRHRRPTTWSLIGERTEPRHRAAARPRRLRRPEPVHGDRRRGGDPRLRLRSAAASSGSPAARVCVVGLGHVGAGARAAARRRGLRADRLRHRPGQARRSPTRSAPRWVEPGDAIARRVRRARPVRARRRDRREDNVDAAALRDRLRLGQQPARRRRARRPLADRGILYAPDFIANAGGLINVYGELHDLGSERLDQLADGIGDATAGCSRSPGALDHPA